MDKKISVIVPIYNTAKYLDKCISSIVKQSYENLEIILINDGSQDNSEKICIEWSQKDFRIKYIKVKNSGAAKAKNIGLDNATGDVVSFIDSDDWIDKEMFCECIDIMNKYDADIVETPLYRTTQEAVELPVIKKQVFEFGTEEALLEIMRDKKLHQTPCNKLYNRNTISDIRFVEGKYIDDEYWTYRVFARAQKIILFTKYFYFYRIHSESAMGRKYNIKRLDAVEALEKRCEFINDNFPALKWMAVSSYLAACYYHLQCIGRNPSVDPTKKEQKILIHKIKSIPLSSRIYLLRYKSTKQKIWYLLFYIVPRTTVWFRNILKIGF